MVKCAMLLVAAVTKRINGRINSIQSGLGVVGSMNKI